jgi:hypothetical protein
MLEFVFMFILEFMFMFMLEFMFMLFEPPAAAAAAAAPPNAERAGELGALILRVFIELLLLLLLGGWLFRSRSRSRG